MEFTTSANMFLSFITSIGFYRLFFTINRPVVRWRFFAMYAIVIFIRPLCMALQLYLAKMSGGFLEPNITLILVTCFSNLLSLFICALPGPNRLRAFVAASFALSIIHVAEIPVIYFTSAIVFLFSGPFDSLDVIPQIPQRYYLIVFLINLIVMCSCFLAARWFRKTQEKPPLKISFYFCLFFISFAVVMAFFVITIWMWNIMTITPLSLLALALLGTLLVCIPHLALYFFSRLTVRKEKNVNIQDMSGAEYTQFIGRLSRRELEVIEAILAGNASQKELSVSLNISVNTVKKHLQHIYQTTGTANMTALTVLFNGYSPNKP
jgi:DNA-binding CsgD family transcriptional regulator